MNRLSVRLSIAGAVVTLGAAAAALQMLSPGDVDQPAGDAGQQQVGQVDPASSPTPIRTEDVADSAPVGTLEPPPASAFTRPLPLRTVSHEDATDGSSSAFPTADPIPTLADNNESSPATSAYALPARESDGDSAGNNLDQPGDLSGAPAGAGHTDRAGGPVVDEPSSPVASTAIPEAPQYQIGVEEPGGSAAAAASADRSSASSGPPTPPPASAFPLLNTERPTASVSDSPVTAASPADPYPSTTPSTTSSTTPSTTPVASAPYPSMVPTQPATNDTGLSARESASPEVGGAEPATTVGSGATLSPGPEMTRTGATSFDPSVAWGSGQELPASRGMGSYPSTSAVGTRSLATSPAAQAGAAPPVGAAVLNAQSAVPAALSSDMPGDRALEGQQSPAIVLEKTAPDEIQVDRKATFQIRVRNVGNAAAHNVIVVDRVPRGTEYVDAVPECSPTADGMLVWNLQTVQANEEVILAVNLLPKVAGEIGSVAQVAFQAQASVRTICTKPQLSLALTAPEQVLIGTTANIEIVVTNTGSGAAAKVIIEEDVPEGFTHAAGRQLEHEVGTLLPQESRRLTLALEASKPGVYENRLTVRGEGNLLEEDLRSIEVTTPKLELSMQGPALRYLDRQATYVVRMANPGTAPARNVELVTYLPKGMKYVTSNNHGQYDSQTHAVYWSLEELPAEKQGDVHLTVLPIEPGNHKLKADGHAELGLQHTCEHEVVVEGLAAPAFSVTDGADPIEVGSGTTYEIRVHNRGSKADSDVRIVAELPPGMMPTAGDGPVPATVQGQQVVFSPLARLAPDEEAIFKIHATGQTVGDHLIRVQLQSAEVRVPVTKEEITRVYTDQ